MNDATYTIPLPRSLKTEPRHVHNYMHLRPGDRILFKKEGIELAVKSAHSTSDAVSQEAAVDASGEVQVKSSVPTDQDVKIDDADEQTDSEDDEAETSTAPSYQTPGQTETVTPATSRPTGPLDLPVKETPSFRAINGQELPYSTAPEPQVDPEKLSHSGPGALSTAEAGDGDNLESSATSPDLDSPTARRQKSQDNAAIPTENKPPPVSQAEPENGVVIGRSGGTPAPTSFPESQDLSGFTEEISKNGKQKTYGRRDRPKASAPPGRMAHERSSIEETPQKRANGHSSPPKKLRGTQQDIVSLASSDVDGEDELVSPSKLIGRGRSGPSHASGKLRRSKWSADRREAELNGQDELAAEQIKSEDDAAATSNRGASLRESSPPNEKTIARTAARRSLHIGSSPATGFHELAPKKAASSTPASSFGKRKTIETPDTDEEPPRKIQRSSTKALARQSTVESSDEIVVAAPDVKGSARKRDPIARSSPQVVVPPAHLEASPEAPQSSVGSSYSGRKPKVLYSSSSTIPNRGHIVKRIGELGAQFTEDLANKSSNFFCVKQGKLSITANLLRSLALKKTIVTDAWVLESVAADRLLDADDYLPDELEGTMDEDRSRLLKGYIVYFTPMLKKDYADKKAWKDIEALATELGARFTISETSRKLLARNEDDKRLLIGLDHDTDVIQLLNAEHTVYHKDFLAHSILAGKLDLENEEFQLEAPSKPAKKGKKK